VAHGVAEIVNTEFLIIAALLATGLIGLLFWAMREVRDRQNHDSSLPGFHNAFHHQCNMAQIQQALDAADLEFAMTKGGRKLMARLRRERRRVTLLYLAAIRKDFEQSLRVAQVIAMLSPEVSGSQEYERLRLSLIFRWRLQLVKVRLLIGLIPQPQIMTLGQMAASLAMQLEITMAKLGERAALAAELALQSGK